MVVLGRFPATVSIQRRRWCTTAVSWALIANNVASALVLHPLCTRSAESRAAIKEHELFGRGLGARTISAAGEPAGTLR